MKKIVFKGCFLMSFFAVVSLLNSCSTIKELEYNVTENPLQMHADDVTLQINGKFVEKGLNAKAVAEVTPLFVCNDGTEIAFQTEIFQGPKAAGNGKVVPKEGTSFSYSSTIPYQKCMEEGIVKVRVVAKKGKKEEEMFTDKIADGTIITPYLLKLDDQVISAKDAFQRITSHESEAVINFNKGQATVKSSELKDQDIVDLMAFVLDATTNPRHELKSVNVSSYASPEGEVDKNENLAKDRAESAKSALVKKMKKMKYEAGQADAFYTIDPKGEDWAGFKTEVEKTTHEDKELILRVLQMTTDLNKREQEIRNMAKTYTFLEKEVLPQLRRSQMTLSYDKVGYSDEELKDLSKTNPDTLNVEELLFTATLYDDLSEQLRVYNEALRLFPNDWRTANNVGCVQYLQGDLDAAGTSFEKASEASENETVNNNIGAVAHMKGDRERAMELFTSAGSSSETNYNLGLLKVQQGLYDEAVSNMGTNMTFNSALANLLSGDADAAAKSIDGSNSKDEAMSYYLKALIGARTNNSEMLMDNLKIAFEKDANLKAKAKRDREFIQFFENADFLAIF
jgi:Tfp pilus assembly protein PilF/outer membrane protein OmpA-like peptidoglycan-associated protein